MDIRVYIGIGAASAELHLTDDDMVEIMLIRLSHTGARC